MARTKAQTNPDPDEEPVELPEEEENDDEPEEIGDGGEGEEEGDEVEDTSALNATIDSFVAVLLPFREAVEASNEAKQSQMSAGDTSIRAFAEQARSLNAPLNDKEIKHIASGIAERLYPKSVAVRTSEFRTLLRNRAHLPQIISGIDKITEKLREAAKEEGKKPKTVNIRQMTIFASRQMVKGATVEEAVGDVDAKVTKHPPTKNEALRSQIEKLRELKVFREKVGNDTVVKDDAEWAIAALLAMLDGEQPDIFTHPAVIAAMDEADDSGPETESEEAIEADQPVEEDPDTPDVPTEEGESEGDDGIVTSGFTPEELIGKFKD